MTNGTPPFAKGIQDMLDALRDFLPSPASALPEPSVSVVSVEERGVGVGNRLSNEMRNSFSTTVLKGGRLDAVVRFQLWASTPDAVDQLIDTLHGELLAAKDALRLIIQEDEPQVGSFLNIALGETSLADFFQNLAPGLSGWRKTANYKVLYEFRYPDTEGAESLIHRIPIAVNSHGESTVVTDEIIRWDGESAPALAVSGTSQDLFQVGALTILAFLPEGWDGDQVIVSATVNGTARERVFASVRDFLNAFDLDETPVTLGGNPYLSGRLAFPNADFPDPIILRGDDVLRIRYVDPVNADNPRLSNGNAVAYLRVLP